MSEPMATIRDIAFAGVPAYEKEQRAFHIPPVPRSFYRDAPHMPGRRNNFIDPEPADLEAYIASLRLPADDQDLLDKIAAESEDF